MPSLDIVAALRATLSGKALGTRLERREDRLLPLYRTPKN